MSDLEIVNLYIPDKDEILSIKEGSGFNLSKQDIKKGYKDYIYYAQYSLGETIEEVDGGELMTKKLLRDKYESLEQTIKEVLKFTCDYIPDYIILKKNKGEEENVKDSKNNNGSRAK